MIHTDGKLTIAMRGSLPEEQDASLGHSVRVPEPQSPQEARLDAALDEAMEFAAWRVFVTLHERLTPLVVSGMSAEEILGVLSILENEYQERYEAVRRGVVG